MNKARRALVVALSIIMSACGGLVSKTPSTNTAAGSVTAVNHIIYMMQENRSFDHYFGQLNAYRQSQGLGADVDGTPADPAQLSFDRTPTFSPFHMKSKCVEDLSAYWNESHSDWSQGAPL